MARVRPTAALQHELQHPLPQQRKITVIAQDPSVRTRDGRILMATIKIPAEDLIAGPTGHRVQVVDYDSSSGEGRYYGAHTLPATHEEEPPGWQRGDPRIVKDLGFHAQNAYALVMKTLARFEFALGRRISWSFRTHQLKVAPHGMFDANAFYSPQEEGLVFGYFAGTSGEVVFTCLSHDIVVHETTHALIDSLRERYMDPSNPDQAAFHEGLADVIALLSVFAQPEVVQHLLSGGKKTSDVTVIPRSQVTADALRTSALFGLADEMGQEIEGIRGHALRHSASLEPNPTVLELPEFQEAHRRGEVFVAAVLNGFIQAWADRIVNSGLPNQTAYPLARVAEEGADIADKLATMWIRALDYMPPVHLQFGDALSAALTADIEVRPDDSRYQLRAHMTQHFAAYGIAPASNRADPPGIWEDAPPDLRFERVRFDPLRTEPDEIFRFLWENRDTLNLRMRAYTEVLTVDPCVRVGPDGFVLHETVAQYYQVARLTPRELAQQSIKAPADYLSALRRLQREQRKAARRDRDVSRDSADDDCDITTPLYGGGVLVFDEFGRLRYHIHNDVLGTQQSARLAYLWTAGLLEPRADRSRYLKTRLATLHRLRAMGVRRTPSERW
jgi:hypothetical protein